jgi:hypothetical protein
LGHPVSGGHKYGDLVLQVGGLGVGITIQPCKRVIVTKPQKRRQGPNWAAEPYDNDEQTIMIHETERHELRRKLLPQVFGYTQDILLLSSQPTYITHAIMQIKLYRTSKFM